MLIFIDGFPFYYLDKAPQMSQFEGKARLIPGFGYSINCQLELFTGLQPDEVGYFGDWTYAPERSPFRRAKILLRLLNPVGRVYYLDRLLHKALGKITRIEVKNIPFSYLPMMAPNSGDIFKREISVDLFHGAATFFWPDFLHLKWGKRDAATFIAAMDAIEADGKVVLTFTELDHIAHACGVGSPEFDHHVEHIDSWVSDLKEEFLKRYPDGVVIVVSDHGMVNVNKRVHIKLESVLGTPGKRPYAYFLDGTILRVWTFDARIRARCKEYLNSLEVGVILTSDERKRWGVSSPTFGDIIFVANEGVMFVPSFWGRKLSRAMHGYLPDLASQHGIFLCSQPLKDDMFTANQVYRELAKLLGKDVGGYERNRNRS